MPMHCVKQMYFHSDLILATHFVEIITQRFPLYNHKSYNREHCILYFFFGTFAPAFLAFDKPIAIACFELVTFFPLPVFSTPSFFSCIAFSTSVCAFFEYLAMAFSYKRASKVPWCRPFWHYFIGCFRKKELCVQCGPVRLGLD